MAMLLNPELTLEHALGDSAAACGAVRLERWVAYDTADENATAHLLGAKRIGDYKPLMLQWEHSAARKRGTVPNRVALECVFPLVDGTLCRGFIDLRGERVQLLGSLPETAPLSALSAMLCPACLARARFKLDAARHGFHVPSWDAGVAGAGGAAAPLGKSAEEAAAEEAAAEEAAAEEAAAEEAAAEEASARMLAALRKARAADLWAAAAQPATAEHPFARLVAAQFEYGVEQVSRHHGRLAHKKSRQRATNLLKRVQLLAGAAQGNQHGAAAGAKQYASDADSDAENGGAVAARRRKGKARRVVLDEEDDESYISSAGSPLSMAGL
jgi:hypothetical protein